MFANPQNTMLLQSTQMTFDIPDDQQREMALAERAAEYLDKQGFDHLAVVRCLVEEFELDVETAEARADLAA